MLTPRRPSSVTYAWNGIASSGVWTPLRLTRPSACIWPGDRQRIAGRPHHSTDTMKAVVIIHEAKLHDGSAPDLLAADLDLERDEILPLRLVELGMNRGDEEIAGHDAMALHHDRLVLEETEIPNGAHDGGVARIAQCLVLHHVDLTLIGEGERAIPPPVWKASSVPIGSGNSTVSSSLSASTCTGFPPRNTQEGVV